MYVYGLDHGELGEHFLVLTILTYASHQAPSPNHVTIICEQMTYTTCDV